MIGKIGNKSKSLCFNLLFMCYIAFTAAQAA